ncbi:MAG: hypothetical protein U0556_09785 [Dehalococcoidia bacterium]
MTSSDVLQDRPGTLRIDIHGARGELSPRSFVDIIDRTLGVLAELEPVISGERKASIHWVIVRLIDDVFGIEISAISDQSRPSVGIPPRLLDALLDGVEEIQGAGTIPPDFTETATRKVRRLAEVIGRNGARGVTLMAMGKVAEVTAGTKVAAEELLRIRKRTVGEVEGRLEMISIHNRPRFVVYDQRTRRATSCYFSPNQLEHVKAALGRRVIVRGRVLWNSRQQAVRVEVERLRVLKNTVDLGQSFTLRGADPDFTGGLPSEAYVRALRDE